MAINYASFQVQAPRTNQQGIVAAAQGMERRADRHRYGIAHGADQALQAAQQENALRQAYEEAAASGDMEKAREIDGQLANATKSRYNFLASQPSKELRGIASMQDPMQQQMALKQAMAISPEYMQERQSQQAMGSRRSYAPVPVQVPVLDENGKAVLDENNQPVMRTAYEGRTYDPKTNQWQTELLDSYGDPIAYEGAKAFTKGAKGAEGKAKGEAKGKSETVDIMADYESAIAGAVKKATQQASATGEAIVRAEDLRSGLPQIQEVVNELSELSEIATYTMSGRAFDAVVREMGFEPTEGATAAAKYEAIINNQTLPMLRRLLGAAFTEKEGERVGALLGNPKYSPKEKQAQLEAYLNQYLREIEAAERRSGIVPQKIEQSPQQPSMQVDQRPTIQGITEQDIDNMSEEELDALLAQ